MKLKWCFGLKDGLIAKCINNGTKNLHFASLADRNKVQLLMRSAIRTIEPNERLGKSYLHEAKTSLERAGKKFSDGDLLWTTVVVYYAEYYALYSFLQCIGVKCENHFCSILAASLLLGDDKTETINRHKDKRIDAQYYMRVDKENQVGKMLQEAKMFVSMFDNIISNLNEKDITTYRLKLRQLSSSENRSVLRTSTKMS